MQLHVVLCNLPYFDTSAKVGETSSVVAGFGRHGMPRPPLTLTFDRLTLKLVRELHLRWGTFLPNLGPLDVWVLELFAMYTTDGEIDRRTDRQADRRTDGLTKAMLIVPFPRGAGT